jgi:hypothetical protein
LPSRVWIDADLVIVRESRGERANPFTETTKAPTQRQNAPEARRFLGERVANGRLRCHFVWTRNRKAVYYLGRIDGDWLPEMTPEYVEADIVNVRPCIWTRVGTMDNVSGAVINAFRPAATLQNVSDASANTVTDNGIRHCAHVFLEP